MRSKGMRVLYFICNKHRFNGGIEDWIGRQRMKNENYVDDRYLKLSKRVLSILKVYYLFDF